MKRKGLVADPERFQLVRLVKLLNEVRPMANAIKRGGEVKQNGVGKTWWEKSSVFMARVRDKAAHAVKTAWRKVLDGRGKDDRKGPDLDR